MKEFDPGESASIVSVTDRVRPVPLGFAVSAVHFLGERAFFVGTEEKVAAASTTGEVSEVEVHFGAILCAASDGTRIVSGGDDGKLVATDAKGETSVLATDAKAALDRQCRAASRRRLCLVGRQDGVRAQRQGRGEIL